VGVIVWCDPLAVSRETASGSRPLAQIPVGALRFPDIDQAIAVRVEASKLLAVAEKLGWRHVAIAIAIHLAEPQRAARAIAEERQIAMSAFQRWSVSTRLTVTDDQLKLSR